MRRRLPTTVIVLAFVALASGFGQDLISPALPGFLVLLGVSRAGIGLVDGLLQGATALFRLVSGLASDRWRARKPLVFLGYLLSSAARPLLAAAGGFGAIAALRTADGAGKGAKDAPRDALVADAVGADIRGRAFGFHRLVDTAGSVLGPLAAGTLLLALLPSLATYRLIFALAAIPGVIALALMWFGVHEPERTERKTRAVRARLPAAFWIFTAGTTVAMLTRVNDALFLVRAHDAGVPLAWVPILFAGFTLLYAMLSYPIGIWSDRVGRLPLLIAGWLVLAGTEFGFSFVHPTVWTALPVFAGFGLFYALTEGSGRAFIADLVGAEARGTAYAVFSSLTGVALIAGGFGIGKLWDALSPSAAFQIASTGSVIGALVLATALRRRTASIPSS